MSDVEFPEEKYNQGAEFDAPKESMMVKWVMKTGLVRDEKQANLVLLGLAVVFFAFTWWVIANGQSTPSRQAPDTEQGVTTESRLNRTTR
jgi:hypothetical protein